MTLARHVPDPRVSSSSVRGHASSTPTNAPVSPQQSGSVRFLDLRLFFISCDVFSANYQTENRSTLPTTPSPTIPEPGEMTVSSGEATTLRSPITHPQPSHSQTSMSDFDLPTGAESMWIESTPRTSSSTFSSQEKSHLSQHQPLSLGYLPAGALNHPDGPRAPIYTKPSEALRPCPTNDSGETLVAGQKRTANGEVKISKPAHTPMYHDLTASTHSRNTSTVSNGSLTEVSLDFILLSINLYR